MPEGLKVRRYENFSDISLRDGGCIESERAPLGPFWGMSVRSAVEPDLQHSLSKKRKVRWGAKHSPAARMPESVRA